jgi:hypothetical protein
MTSTIKVNNIQNQCGANIANKCGTTITLGASGDTVTLASGASQTGFGRTGTVDWDTTAKTASFTAVSGNGYFVNTTSGAITVTLPAGSAGDIVGISDYASTFQTNNVTITPNGTDKINGANENATLSTQGIAVSLVYVDATRGWKSVTGSDNDTTGIPLPAYVTATGGTVTCCGDYKIHTFTGPGTFCVSCAGNAGGSSSVDYLVVAGGAAGGFGGSFGGGGGAGGYRESSGAASGCYTVSPLGTGVSALAVSVQGYPITVGGGGTGISPPAPVQQGNDGSNSVFSTIISTGGGGGGNYPVGNGRSGGSGGGSANSTSGGGAGSGNTPPVSPPQGQNGGSQTFGFGPSVAGGGGATAAGGSAGPSGSSVGGNGATSSINGTPTARAGGGGGGAVPCVSNAGGTGGGGQGGFDSPNVPGVSGTANTGGGGGGNGPTATSAGSGGSGIVIIRYKYQ